MLGAVVAAAIAVAGATTAQTATAHPPRMSLDARDQAQARGVLVRPADLGSGWKVDPTFRFLQPMGAPCAGFDPDLSALTVTGRSATRVIDRVGQHGEQDVVVAAFVFASAREARQMQATAAIPYAKRCLRPGGAGGPIIRSVTRIARVTKADDEVGWRFRLEPGSGAGSSFVEYVFLRTRSFWVSVTLVSSGRPVPGTLERRALAAVALRMAR